MRSSNPTPFAPRWLRCAGCVTAMLLLPSVIALTAFGRGDGWLLLAILPLVWLFSYGLHGLLTGQPPRSPVSFAADLMHGRFEAKQDVSKKLP